MFRHLVKFSQVLLILILSNLIFFNSYSQSINDLNQINARFYQQQNTNARGDVYTLCQAIYDIYYKFDDEKIHDEYLKSINIKKGSTNFITKDLMSKISKDLKAIKEIPAGSACNTAIGLSSFNNIHNSIQFVIGDDKIGKSYENYVKNNGLTYVKSKTISNEKTDIVMVIIAPDGERTMLAHIGISQRLAARDIDKEDLKSHKIVFSEGFLWSDDKDNNIAIQNLFKYAKEKNIKRAFALSNYSVVKKYRQQFLDLIQDMDLIFADKQQIFELFGSDNWNIVNEALSKYNNTIFVITCAEEGAFIFHNKKTIYIPIYNIRNAIDTTAAGDQFAAGFLYAYLHNKLLEACGRLGALSAGQIIQQIGATPVIPFSTSLKEIIKY